MKISLLILPAALALMLLTACEDESRPRTRQNTAAQTGSNNYGYQQSTPGTATEFVTDTAPTPIPAPTTTTDMPPSTATTPPATAPAPVVEQHSVPYGTPVAGKPGFVTSPHAPYAGYVDVRGFPPNTEVKDPYSGKIFLVP